MTFKKRTFELKPNLFYKSVRPYSNPRPVVDLGNRPNSGRYVAAAIEQGYHIPSSVEGGEDIEGKNGSRLDDSNLPSQIYWEDFREVEKENFALKCKEHKEQLLVTAASAPLPPASDYKCCYPESDKVSLFSGGFRESQLRKERARDWLQVERVVKECKVKECKVKECKVKESKVKESKVKESKVKESTVNDWKIGFEEVKAIENDVKQKVFAMRKVHFNTLSLHKKPSSRRAKVGYLRKAEVAQEAYNFKVMREWKTKPESKKTETARKRVATETARKRVATETARKRVATKPERKKVATMPETTRKKVATEKNYTMPCKKEMNDYVAKSLAKLKRRDLKDSQFGIQRTDKYYGIVCRKPRMMKIKKNVKQKSVLDRILELNEDSEDEAVQAEEVRAEEVRCSAREYPIRYDDFPYVHVPCISTPHFEMEEDGIVSMFLRNAQTSVVEMRNEKYRTQSALTSEKATTETNPYNIEELLKSSTVMYDFGMNAHDFGMNAHDLVDEKRLEFQNPLKKMEKCRRVSFQSTDSAFSFGEGLDIEARLAIRRRRPTPAYVNYLQQFGVEEETALGSRVSGNLENLIVPKSTITTPKDVTTKAVSQQIEGIEEIDVSCFPGLIKMEQKNSSTYQLDQGHSLNLTEVSQFNGQTNSEEKLSHSYDLEQIVRTPTPPPSCADFPSSDNWVFTDEEEQMSNKRRTPMCLPEPRLLSNNMMPAFGNVGSLVLSDQISFISASVEGCGASEGCDDYIGVREDEYIGVREDEDIGVREDEYIGVREDEYIGVVEDEYIGVREDDIGVVEDDGIVESISYKGTFCNEESGDLTSEVVVEAVEKIPSIVESVLTDVSIEGSVMGPKSNFGGKNLGSEMSSDSVYMGDPKPHFHSFKMDDGSNTGLLHSFSCCEYDSVAESVNQLNFFDDLSPGEDIIVGGYKVI